MEELIQTVLVLLAAVGLFSVGWVLLGRLLVPAAEEGGVYAVVSASGGGDRLEHDVKGLLWLRECGWARFTVVIADGGLDQAGRAAAEALVKDFPGLKLCPADRLGEYLAGK